MTCTLARLAPFVLDVEGDPSTVVVGATHNSTMVEPGVLFCCVPGESFDGHDFARDAVASGAAALLVERRLDLDVPQLVVDNVRSSMGCIAAEIYDNPTDGLNVVGVTGTNGKTTITQILATVLEHDGRPTATVGTLSGARTTPEAPELQAMLAGFVAEGKDTVALEVSSHALELHRVDGCQFDVAIFTNLGRDHLDFHVTQEAYFDAKAKLFSSSLTRYGVINVDDPWGRRLADQTDVEVVEYQLSDARSVCVDGEGTTFEWKGVTVRLGLAGSHNVSNALAALTAAVLLGLTPAQAAAGMAEVVPPSGRFEFVPNAGDVSVVVDYAHTPDALEAAIAASAEVAGDGQVIVVFGCGGDRDRQKRPEMGAVAAANADHVIITSDNPRSEDPSLIVESIIGGMQTEAPYTIELDRRRAIEHAIGGASAGDIVLVAGKGHETQQVIGTETYPFDDRVVAAEALRARFGPTATDGGSSAGSGERTP